MSILKGIDFLIKINMGTEASPNWQAVAGQKGATLSLGMDTIDVTTKDSNFWKENIPGARNWSIKGDMIVMSNASGSAYTDVVQAIEDKFMSHEQVQVQFSTPLGVNYTGMATITDLSFDAPHDGEYSGSVSLEGTGALNKA